MLIQTCKCYRLVDNSCVKLIYDVYGNPEAPNLVLCLHGLGGNAAMFSNFTNLFPENYKILTVDLFGHGRSDHVNLEHYEVQRYSEDVLNVLNCLDFDQVFCIGSGIGVLIACKLASAKNSPIRSIVADLLDNKIDHRIFKEALLEQNFEAILQRAETSEHNKAEAQIRPNSYDAYLKYLIRHFNFTKNGLSPIYDYQAFKTTDFAAAEGEDLLLKALSEVECPVMLLATKKISQKLHKINQRFSICSLEYAKRIEYQMQEIERIVQWIHHHKLNEEERVKNLLGIDSGKRHQEAHYQV